MADFRAVEQLRPERTVTTYQGTMVTVDDVLQVSVNGNILPARYADPLVLSSGDPVLVEISSTRGGGGEAFVRCRLTDKPRPGQGKVLTVPPSSPIISVTGSDGVVYPNAKFLEGYTPIVGDTVLLSWNAAVPTVQGKVTLTAAPPPVSLPVAAPPSPSSTGSTPYIAAASDTYWPAGGWGSWASGGSHVYQGSFGSGPVYGAWFYGGSTAQLADRNITRIRFTLGGRRPVGNNNQPVTIHLYAHTSAHKPGGDVNRIVGPHDITVQPGQGLTDYDLPLSFAQALKDGGGIAIAGDPYAGFFGRSAQPESGRLIIDWSY